MLIISRGYGRLGNRLSQFAHFIAFAKEYNLRIINPYFCKYAKYFEATKDNFLCSFPKSKIGRHRFLEELLRLIIRGIEGGLCGEKINNRVISAFRFKNDCPDIEQIKMRMKKIFFLFVSGGYFRDYKNVKKHSEDIKNYFTPVKIHRDNVNNLMRIIRKKTDVVVGVHLRRTDYKFWEGSKYYYQHSEYLEFMSKIKFLLSPKKVGFLLCSDEKLDLDFFKQIDYIFNGSGHFIEDLYCFSGCDFLIGPPSTYTIWASFYGNVPLLMVRSTNEEIQLDKFRVWKEI